MAKFSFLHLIGLNPKAQDDDEEDKSATENENEDDSAEGDEDDKDSRAEGEENEEDAEGEENEEDAEGEEDDKDARAARRQGRLAERRRCAAIFAAPAAQGRVGLAAELAFNTSLPARSAIGILTASPKDAAGKGGLAAAMARLGNPRIGTDSGRTPQGDIAAGWDKAVARVNDRTAASVGRKR